MEVREEILALFISLVVGHGIGVKDSAELQKGKLKPKGNINRKSLFGSVARHVKNYLASLAEQRPAHEWTS